MKNQRELERLENEILVNNKTVKARLNCDTLGTMTKDTFDRQLLNDYISDSNIEFEVL